MNSMSNPIDEEKKVELMAYVGDRWRGWNEAIPQASVPSMKIVSDISGLSKVVLRRLLHIRWLL